LSLEIQSTVDGVVAKPKGISASFYFDNLRTEMPDTTAPTVGALVADDTLWSPNHKMVNVGLDAVADDDTDAEPALELLVYSNESNEADKNGPDAVADAKGNLTLRAERSGSGNGRIYLVVVTATDLAGNVGYDCATVLVPKSKGKKQMASIVAAAIVAEEFCLETGSAPAGWHLLN
jgi:hypothetical protein